jgi:hypothetical protein
MRSRYFLGATGASTPLSSNLFAFKPSEAAYKSAMSLATNMALARSSDLPWAQKIPTNTCSTVFFWALFYSPKHEVRGPRVAHTCALVAVAVRFQSRAPSRF